MTVPLALAGIWAVSGIAAIIMIVHAIRQPITDTDRYCDAIDQERTLVASGLDTRTLDDIRWAAIEEQWQSFIDSWPTKEQV
jgi:hypothetical protein